MRTCEELLTAYQAATKENPLVLKACEHDNFCKAMDDLAASYNTNKMRLTIHDADVNFKSSVLSHADGKYYTNKKEWESHLKARNLVEVGNEKPKKRELAGDYNCRAELSAAIKEVTTKQKYR
jgi:hypothetical protein